MIARRLAQSVLLRLLRRAKRARTGGTSPLPTTPITFLTTKRQGRLGRHSCLACRQRVSGPARHVCAGTGRGRAGGPGRKTKLRIAERDGWICQLCGEAVDARLPARHPLSATIDHRTPRGAGGSRGSLANMQLAHQLCNNLRAAVPLESLDLANLRADFARAWTRYLQNHPEGTPETVIARCERERERRRLLRIRRREERRAARAAASTESESSSRIISSSPETHPTAVLDGRALLPTSQYV